MVNQPAANQPLNVGADAILTQVTDLSDPCAASGIPSKVMIAEYSNGSMTSGGLGQNRISANIESTKTVIDRVEAQFDIKPQRLIGDTEYGTAPMLAWMGRKRTSNLTCRCGTKPRPNNPT